MRYTKVLLPILIVLLAGILIYNSKRDYYINASDFFEKNIHGIISKINEGRGTKVYYSRSDFFYLEQISKPLIRIGDSINKIKADMKVFRKNDFGEFILSHKVQVLKTKKSYFNFFFGL